MTAYLTVEGRILQLPVKPPGQIVNPLVADIVQAGVVNNMGGNPQLAGHTVAVPVPQEKVGLEPTQQVDLFKGLAVGNIENQVLRCQLQEFLIFRLGKFVVMVGRTPDNWKPSSASNPAVARALNSPALTKTSLSLK